MSVTIDVPYDQLTRAKRQWDSASDELDPSWRRLAHASTDGFSPAVAAAVAAFREPWVDRIKSSATIAEDNAEAIVLVAGHLKATDVAQADRIRSLLPWAYRDAPVRQS